MKKERKEKVFNELIKSNAIYLQDVQESRGCSCGRDNCPLRLALVLLEYCDMPIEDVAKIFLYWQTRFLEAFFEMLCDRIR